MIEKDEKPRSRWTGRIVIKYVLLQIPSTVLLILILILINQRLEIPSWLFLSIIIGSVLKDILLFPFVWRSYDSKSTHPIVGAYGVAAESLSPSGYVKVHGQLWQAELAKGYESVDVGEIVRVIEAKGIKLVVEPEIKKNPRMERS
jgi:membrane protein implicated in regulation of membrane protease activity